MFEVSSLLVFTSSFPIVVAAAAVEGLFTAVEGFASWFYCRLSARVILGLAPVAAAAFGDAFPCCTPPPIVLAGACLMAGVDFSFCTISLFYVVVFVY